VCIGIDEYTASFYGGGNLRDLLGDFQGYSFCVAFVILLYGAECNENIVETAPSIFLPY
jgi:hypothetical protein